MTCQCSRLRYYDLTYSVTSICSRAVTQEDLLCDECRTHKICQIENLEVKNYLISQVII